MNRFIYILPIIALVCGYVLWADSRRKKHIDGWLRNRPQLTAREFGIQYFPPKQAEIATETRQLLEKHLPFRLDGLQPSDSFSDDLRIATFCRTGMIAYLMDLEEHFDVKLRHRQDIAIRTVGDLVEAIAGEHEKKKNPTDDLCLDGVKSQRKTT